MEMGEAGRQAPEQRATAAFDLGSTSPGLKLQRRQRHVIGWWGGTACLQVAVVLHDALRCFYT